MPPRTIEPVKIPQHIAIIMDGNARWAKARRLPRLIGHRAGRDKAKEIMEFCDELGIKFLTLYAFSTENWSRPRNEVSGLMKLLEETLRNELDSFISRNARLRVIGDRSRLSPHLADAIQNAEERTSGATGIMVNIALNYGGRAEILHACRSLVKDAIEGRISPEEIDEATFESRLYTSGIPAPDLLIRTGGEMRVSNFLLWQIAYTELWVTPVLWPDFSKDDLLEAINDFATRERRYGGRSRAGRAI